MATFGKARLGVVLTSVMPSRGGTSVVCFNVLLVLPLLRFTDGGVCAKDTLRFGSGICASSPTFGDVAFCKESLTACEEKGTVGESPDDLPRGMNGVQDDFLVLGPT